MTTDYRALCAELLQAWDDLPWEYDFKGNPVGPLAEIDDTPFEQAREALAQPEPVGPTDEGVAELRGCFERILCVARSSGGPTVGNIQLADRLIGAVLQRWGHPAIAPIPVSEFLEPEWVRQEDQTHKTTDHAQLIDGEWWAPYSDLFSMQRILDNARAYAARWGRPALTPIPVSERLPGVEECAPWPEEPDCDPWCWAAKDIDGGWEWTQLGIGHFSSDLGRVWRKRGYTHWLPASALPLPGQPAPASPAP